MDDKPVVISHHCWGSARRENGDLSDLVWLECFEEKETGRMILISDRQFRVVVSFCPLCGKESKHHASLINQETVRMVEHA